MTRQLHLEWCKERALVYVNMGDTKNGYISMAQDLKKHPETKGHIGIELGMMLLMNGKLNTIEEMRKFINGFN